MPFPAQISPGRVHHRPGPYPQQPYFRDTFTDPDGTLLSAHTPDYSLSGNRLVASGTFSAEPTLQGNQLLRGAGANPAYVVDVGQADVSVYADYTQSTAGGGLALRFQDITHYWLLFLGIDGFVYILQAAGSLVQQAIGRLPSSNGQTFSLEFRAHGTTISALVNGVIVCECTSSTYQSATKHGLGLGAGSGAQRWDQVRIESPSGTATWGSMTVTAPAPYQVYQRSGLTGSVVVAGSYRGDAAGGLEARFHGGPWQALTVGPGTFSGTLTGQPAGQGRFEIRFTAHAAESVRGVDLVGIGDVFIVAGQSNAEGRFTSLFTYSHPTLKAGMFRSGESVWRELTDPTDLDNPLLGSCWPLLATRVMAATGLPCAFVTIGVGGTALAIPNWHWNKAHAPSNTAYQVGVSVVAAAKLAGAIVLWYQGESDALNPAVLTSSAVYSVALVALRANLAADLGFPNLPMVVASLAQNNPGAGETRATMDFIRQAQLGCHDADPLLFRGPVLYDLLAADTQHLTTPAQAATEALRWFRALQEHCFGGAAESGRGPRKSAVTQVDATHLDVTWTVGTAPLLPATPPTAGWYVTDNGTPVTVSAAARPSAAVVRLTVPSMVSGHTIAVSWASFNDAAGVTLTDSDPDALPAEPFYAASFTAT